MSIKWLVATKMGIGDRGGGIPMIDNVVYLLSNISSINKDSIEISQLNGGAFVNIWNKNKISGAGSAFSKEPNRTIALSIKYK